MCCAQGFGREAKRFAVWLAEAIVPSALLEPWWTV